MTILKTIVDFKALELEENKRTMPLSNIEKRIKAMPAPLNLSGALMGDEPRLIAEAKKASPSKGLLREQYDPVELSTAYANNGAAAVSVLTETKHFQGSLIHMLEVKQNRQAGGLPVLRKDFIFDPYQIYESRAYGADALLLIVSLLTPELLQEMLKECQKLWVQALVEVHDEDEVEIALKSGAEIIGINNRDLRTFKTDISVTERLSPMIGKNRIIVSESGIHTRSDILRLHRSGINGVLIGEALVTADNPGEKVAELLRR